MSKLFTTVCALALCTLLSACAGSTANTAADADNVSSSGMQPVASADTENEGLDPDAMRCKVYTKTGTRIATKVCKTNREWEQAARDSREATEQIQRGSLQGPGPEGG